MAQIRTQGYFERWEEVAENSLDITSKDLVTIKDWFITKAIGNDKVYGISRTTKIFPDDNQTNFMAKVVFVQATPRTLFEVDVTGWTIAQANVWSTYALWNDWNVDLTTEGTSLRLSEVLTPTKGLFTAE